MKAGTIASKPVYKEVALRDFGSDLTRLRKKVALKLFLGTTAVVGDILLKAYMALSVVWLAFDKLANKG